MAKTATITLELVDIRISAGRLEFEGAPLAPLGTYSAAIALLVVNLGKIVTLECTDTEIDTAP